MKSENGGAGHVIGAMLERFREKEPPVPGENEYIGENGLLFCSVCRTPKQCRVNMLGQPAVVPCICQCEKERLEKEKKRQEAEELQRRIQRLKANGIQEKHLLDWRFDVAENTAEIQRARKYVENWQKVKAENLGLLLWGSVGTGKSFIAACIANALLEQGIPVLITNFSKILNQMGGMYSDERYQYIASFSHYPLLIIDDLGTEYTNNFIASQFFTCINERLLNSRSTIISTNLSLDTLADLYTERSFSRITSNYIMLKLIGDDIRIKKKLKNREEN